MLIGHKKEQKIFCKKLNVVVAVIKKTAIIITFFKCHVACSKPICLTVCSIWLHKNTHYFLIKLLFSEAKQRSRYYIILIWLNYIYMKVNFQLLCSPVSTSNKNSTWICNRHPFIFSHKEVTINMVRKKNNWQKK